MPVPRETKGLPDEPRNLDELIDLCLQADEARHGKPRSEQEQQGLAELVRCLDDCVVGTTLDFTDFTGTRPDLLLPLIAAQLDGYVRRGHGVGITDVTLPDGADLRTLVPALEQMPDLEHLCLDTPALTGNRQQTIDLHKLGLGHPHGLKVELRGDASNLLIKVPPGSLVRTATDDSPAIHKSLVQYCDAEGEPLSDPCVLAGRTHCHTGGEIDHDVACEVDYNGKALLAPNLRPAWNERKIWCSTLTALWFVECARKNGAGRPGFTADDKASSDFGSFLSPDSISQAVTSEVLSEHDRLYLSTRPESIFNADQLGAAIAHQLRQMALGETRYLALNSPNHAMGLQLKVTQDPHGQPRYTVDFFEPNHTMACMHNESEDPGWFESRPVGHWLKPEDELDYFPDQPRIANLVRWMPQGMQQTSPDDASRAQPVILAGSADMASTAFLVLAMQSPAPLALAQGVTAILDSKMSAQDRFDELEVLEDGSVMALTAAGLRGQADNVTAYVHAVLHADDQVLPAAMKVTLVRACDPDHGTPVLACFLLHPDTRPDPIYAYVHAIAASPLNVGDKCGLIGQRLCFNTSSASIPQAVHTLPIRPERVAAMLCAIVEAGQSPADTKRMLGALGVTRDELCAVMARHQKELALTAGDEHQEAIDLRQWTARLERDALHG